MMTLANKITLVRAALSIVMFLFILMPYAWARFVAILIFIVAASTDWVDGKIARETHTVTPFGAIVDPFVDKILVIAAFFAFSGTIRWNLFNAVGALEIRSIRNTNARYGSRQDRRTVP